MKDLKIVKEYNNASSEKNNMDVFDIYVNDWGVLQYGFRYNEFTKLHDLYIMNTKQRFTGVTLEKMNIIIDKELSHQIKVLEKWLQKKN